MEKTITMPLSEYNKHEKQVKKLESEINLLTKNVPKFCIDKTRYCFIDPEFKKFGRPRTNYIEMPRFGYDTNVRDYKEGLELLQDLVNEQNRVLDSIKQEVFMLGKIKKELTEIKPNFWDNFKRKR